jgi:hypothetical protein
MAELDRRKILIFDNAIKCLETLSRIVEESGYIPIKCDRIRQADIAWFTHCKEIKGIILDLNIPTKGFEKKEQRERAIGGKLTGWVWYIDNVVRGPNKRDDFQKNTLIYSGFIGSLMGNISDEEISILNKIDYRVEKGDPEKRRKIEEFLESLKSLK